MTYNFTENMMRQMAQLLDGEQINNNTNITENQENFANNSNTSNNGNNGNTSDYMDNNQRNEYDNMSDDESDFSLGSDLEPDMEQMEKIVIRDINVTVSSLDRDWYNRTNESPYNFNVKLGGSGIQEQYLVSSYEPKNVVSVGSYK